MKILHSYKYSDSLLLIGWETLISNGSIDELYDMVIKAGALGGKLLGAGGGGFLLFYCEKDKQEYLKKALDKLMIVPFNFENDGAQVLYYAPQNYSPRKEILLR